MTSPFVEVRDLRKEFLVGGRVVNAVDGVSFSIHRGTTLGLVGESGCGKTTCGRTVAGLYRPTSGHIFFDGSEMGGHGRFDGLELKKRIQMIFQDPYASLNPRMTVSDIVAEGIDAHGLYRGRDRIDRVNALLELVGLRVDHGNRFPHEFSGGQRQRIGIARALAVEPDFIVCDEPISALDVSIQAQIINLLVDLQRRLGLTYLFIAHDLSVVRHISDFVGVMYLGTMMEVAPSDELYANPVHPYTQALLSAVPVPDPVTERRRKRIALSGDIPSPLGVGHGCPLAGRCRHAVERCFVEKPRQRSIGRDHVVACHRCALS